ncbi:MAG: nitroreductase [Sphingobium sp.]
MTREDLLEDARDWTGDSRAVAQLLADRYSCRAFRPDPVPDAIISSLLSVAQLSASWCNLQPWSVIVTKGEATERFRSELFAHAQDLAAGAVRPVPTPDIPFPVEYVGKYKARQRECGGQLYESVGIAFGDRQASSRQALENFRLFGAPHVMIVTSPKSLSCYGAVDCGIYVANVMLLAQSHGIATVAQAALASRADFVRRHFAIADDQNIVCGISFGYADEEHPANAFRTNREAIAAVADIRA